MMILLTLANTHKETISMSLIKKCVKHNITNLIKTPWYLLLIICEHYLNILPSNHVAKKRPIPDKCHHNINWWPYNYNIRTFQIKFTSAALEQNNYQHNSNHQCVRRPRFAKYTMTSARNLIIGMATGSCPAPMWSSGLGAPRAMEEEDMLYIPVLISTSCRPSAAMDVISLLCGNHCHLIQNKNRSMRSCVCSITFSFKYTRMLTKWFKHKINNIVVSESQFNCVRKYRLHFFFDSI